MLRRTSLRTSLLLILTLTPIMLAHEVDNFLLPPGREFADMGPYLSRWMYSVLWRGVEKTNADIKRALDSKSESALKEAQSEDALVKNVNSEFPWALPLIEGLEHTLKSDQMKAAYPGRVTAYRDLGDNVYSFTHLPIDPRMIIGLIYSSTLHAYGVNLGTDKVGHFTDMGLNYWKEYRKQREAGKSEEQSPYRACA